MFQRVLSGRLGEVLRAGFVLLVLLTALFLTFSRGAWGHFALSAGVLMLLTFFTGRAASERLRILILAAIGVMMLAGFLALLLSIDHVAELFKTRAALEQIYDVGHMGRFGRQLLGLSLVLDSPFGIGPLEFNKIFWEDPHNAYLNAFISGGWLAGLSYLALTFVTLAVASRFVLVATPWRPIFHVVYAAYFGVVVESLIIDSDHWRHYFLLLGVLWGLMAATRRFLAERGNGRAAPASARVRPALAPASAAA
jgi:hypothetical protein